MDSFMFSGYIRLFLIDILRGTNIYSCLKSLRWEQFMRNDDLYIKSQKKFFTQLEKAKISTNYYQNIPINAPLPVLTKDLIRQNEKGLFSKSFQGKKIRKATGGSSGNPLIYFTTKEAQSFMWAGIILSWITAGYKVGEPVAFISGTSLSGSDFKHKLFHKLLNIETFSAYNLNDESIAEYLKMMRKQKIKLIYAYSSALDLIADYMLRTGDSQIPTLKAIISTAEILTNATRSKTELAFGVKVYNQYGCNEAGLSAFECPSGSLHLINTGAWTYTDSDDNLIATNLVNEAFLIINYASGDKVKFADAKICACGRGYPVIADIIGRTFEFVKDTKGKLLHAAFFSILFRNDSTIERYQIQYDNEAITILLKVREPVLNFAVYDQYLKKLKEHVSFLSYGIRLNEPFFAQPNGKHLQVVKLSKIDYENLV